MAIDSIEDMERLFAGIPLDAVSTSMTINATATILLALYVTTARRSGCEMAQLSGTVQNDILKEYIARGTYIYPLQPSLRLMADLFAWTGQHLPAWNPISISGYHMREAGATAVQEVAFTLANGRAYLADAAGSRARYRTSPRRVSPSFLPPIMTSSRRWPSSAPRAGSGRVCCRSSSAPATRGQSHCAFIPRPPAPP